MPQWRKLHTKTTESFTVNDMPDDFHRLLWLLIPLVTCREGRGLDNPAWVKAKAMPLRSDINPDDVQRAMDWYANAEIIQRYAVGGRRYFYVINWHKYQGSTDKEAGSIYPDPAEGTLQTNSGNTPDLLQTNSSTEESGCRVDADADAEENRDMGAKASPSSPFKEMSEYWIQLFPEKPKPRYSKSAAGKIKTRMKEQHFRDNWKAAMLRASKSNYVWKKDTTWFDFGWLLQNDSNYEKALNGKYDVKPGTQRKLIEPGASPVGQQIIDMINKGE